jgi:UDP-N-acetyl-D-glucosamine/UDP-N-acetyl-D-galactosamine dehydrogenase
MTIRKVSVIGLGYVGLPLAVAFAKKMPVVGYDVKQSRVNELCEGIDSTLEVDSADLLNIDIVFTSDSKRLSAADFHIIAVPTPVDDCKKPDLSYLFKASEVVASVLKPGDIVVFESTVFPGATEEECVPVLEKYSNLICGEDFFVGYSPERINPGDKEHSFTKITKVVSGQNPEALEIISTVYGSVVEAGIYEAKSIRVAEAAKVIENAQRDINIAFVNELKIIFDKMNIDIYDVLQAAQTKWNFLSFQPGLVGGHCIGVDPYYLTYKAQQLGYQPEVILAGRRINDNMGKYVAQQTIKHMIANDIHVNGTKIGVLGFTFKENCPDVRNTRVIDVVNELKSYHAVPLIYDPIADLKSMQSHYNVTTVNIESISNLEVLVLAVPHDEFICNEVRDAIEKATVIIDIKNFEKIFLNHSAYCEAEVSIT